jgi:hypothetical protein
MHPDLRVDVACGGRGPDILSETVNTGTEHVVSTTAVHDILHDVFIPLWEFDMPSSDAFALRRSGLNEFLFAPVGTEANGMTLSLVSVFARLGNDPWLEAGRLARLPKPEATESLARIIASMPNQRLATTSRDDDCYPIDCTAAEVAGREPGTESASISLWREGRPSYQDWPRAGGRRVRSGLSDRCLHDDIRRTRA